MSESKRKLNRDDNDLPTLMKRKRKKNQMASGQHDADAATVYDSKSIDNLPHEILLIIFNKLNINQVCRMAR